MSLQQVKVRLEGSTGHAVVWARGVNPSFVRQPQDAQFTRMEEHREYELSDGAVIKVRELFIAQALAFSVYYLWVRERSNSAITVLDHIKLIFSRIENFRFFLDVVCANYFGS
jgi:hypothetical protein